MLNSFLLTCGIATVVVFVCCGLDYVLAILEFLQVNVVIYVVYHSVAAPNSFYLATLIPT